MKNINLLISLLCVLFCACSESNDDDSNTPLGQLSVTLKDANGKPVKDAFVVLSGLEGRRLVNMGEGFSKENGSWLPYYKGNVDGYISVVASGYEASKTKVSYDGKYEQKLDITLQESHSLSIMSYNVKDGFENKDNKKQRFLEWIQRYDPDILLFQELNKFTEKSLGEFAKKYGHEYAYIVKEDGYPTGITSRYPLTNVEKILRANKYDIFIYHGCIHAECQGIHIFVTHLSPFEVDDRIKEIKGLVEERIKKLPADAKVLVAGDFNSYNEYDKKAYGPKFETERLQFSPTVAINYEVTNFMLENGFKDAFTLFSDGHFKQSIPVTITEFPENKGCRYDYIMLSENLAADCVYADILREKNTHALSDHYPNYIRLKVNTTNK